MSNIKSIRDRLGLTQADLAKGIGCTQGNVGHYERGQTVPPDAAQRLIDYAKSLGHVLTFNDIYMPELDHGDEPGSLRSGADRRHTGLPLQAPVAESVQGVA